MLALLALLALVASASARMSIPVARTSKAARTQGPAMRSLAVGKVVIDQFENAQYYGAFLLLLSLLSPPSFSPSLLPSPRFPFPPSPPYLARDIHPHPPSTPSFRQHFSRQPCAVSLYCFPSLSLPYVLLVTYSSSLAETSR